MRIGIAYDTKDMYNTAGEIYNDFADKQSIYSIKTALEKLGHDVTAFTSSPNKVQMIKDLGADHVVVSTDPKQMNAVANSFKFIINTLPIKNGFADYLHCTWWSLCSSWSSFCL